MAVLQMVDICNGDEIHDLLNYTGKESYSSLAMCTQNPDPFAITNGLKDCHNYNAMVAKLCVH
jgi:hypothetical protein